MWIWRIIIRYATIFYVFFIEAHGKETAGNEREKKEGASNNKELLDNGI